MIDASPAATGERERADLLAEWDEHGEAVAFVAIRNYAGSANAKHIADYATDWFRRWLATLGRDAPGEPSDCPHVGCAIPGKHVHPSGVSAASGDTEGAT